MKTETVNTDEKPLRSMPWVGEAPPMTPEANGWWWLWNDEQWCAATVEHYESYSGARLMVKWMRQTGGMSADSLRPDEVAAEAWGGRLAVPGASPTDGTQVRAGEGASPAERSSK